jgi:hypothetical protein
MQTTILACASHEYLWDSLGIRDLSDEDVQKWTSKVAEKWVTKGDSIFTQAVHLDVYATTGEGHENGLSFLREEIKA